MKKLLTVLLFCISAVAFSAKPILVMEGKEGFWIFVSDEVLSGNNSKGISRAVISRSEKGGAFTEVGTAAALLDLAAMKKEFGNEFPSGVAKELKLSGEAELPAYLRAHPKLEDYSLLLFSMDFYRLTGGVYFDKYKPTVGTSLKYKVSYYKTDGTLLPEQPEGEIVSGRLPDFTAPKAFSRTENDSAIQIQWLGKASKTQQPFIAHVYGAKGSNGFVQLGKILPLTKGDSVMYTWNEYVLPGNQYRYFIRPANLVGLEGVASDTVTAVSANFNTTQALENFTASDTTGGILFTWKALPANGRYTGICVQRKTLSENDYRSIDTIPLTSSQYLDSRLIANISYQYQFRLVNVRFKLLIPSAAITAIHRKEKRNTHIPVTIQAVPVKNGIEVKWRMLRHYEVNGYYVYRSISNGEYQQYSNLTRDTVFTDTAATNGRTLYTYKVASIDFNDAISELSSPVQAKPLNRVLPQEVSGILTYSEPGKISLQWNNMNQYDEYVTAYAVYRKKGSYALSSTQSVEDLKRAGFERLNKTPVASVLYSDVNASSGTYTYAVTSLDAAGNESLVSQLAEAKPIEKLLAAPSFFSVTKTTSGVLLRWNAELQKDITDYLIYRRQRTETNATLIGTVKASELSYTDIKAATGSFYFYSIKAKSSSGGESDFSPEKGIVR